MGTKRLNVPIDEALHRELKVKVAEKGQTVTQFVTDYIIEKLQREKETEKDE